jgi:hypothetical protein
LFELADAVLCTEGPVRSLVGLSSAPEHQRGHGALYDGINHGHINIARLRNLVAAQRLPRAADGRIVLAVDVSPWLRPDANTSPQRSFCHTYGRGKDQHLMVPGWPYSIVAALETGRTSWTALLDAVRLQPGADVVAVTAVQIREVVARLIVAGQWQPGDPSVLIVLDAGYDAPRTAHLLSEHPVEILGRMRSDRVLRRPIPPRTPGTAGRPPRHGGEFVFGDPSTWGSEHAVTTTDTRLYGTATAQAWDQLHPRLTRRAAWTDHEGPLPIIAGTVIRLQVDHLPSGGDPKPIWLWWSKTDASETDVDRCWQAFLRRFDIEHTFRLFKQTPGLDRPQAAGPAGGRQLDLADDRRAHPTPPRTTTDHRPETPLGEAGRARPTHARTGPTRVSEHPRENPLSGRGAETLPTRPRPDHGSKNQKPAQRHHVGRILATGQAYQRPTHHQKGTKPRRTG